MITSSECRQDTRPGPWGTSRATERRWGYPGPRRLTAADALQQRVAALEARLASLEGARLDVEGRAA